MATPFTIPEGFPELLQDFTVSVLREKPSDIVEYAIVYFTDVATKRNPNRVAINSTPAVIPSNHSIESKQSEVNGVEPVEEDAPAKETSIRFADAPMQNGSDEEEPEDKPAPLFDISAMSAANTGSDDESDEGE